MNEHWKPKQSQESGVQRERPLTSCAPEIATPPGFEWKKCAKALVAAGVLSAATPEVGNANEATDSNIERTTVESVLGAETVKKLENLGFQIDVPVESDESDSYVIHIGQIHTSPGDKVDKAMTQGISESFQSRLLEVLPDIANTGEGVVFNEGIVHDHADDREFIQEKYELIQDFHEAPPTTLKEAHDLTSYLNWYDQYATHRLVRNYFPEGSIETAERTLQAFIDDYRQDLDSDEKTELEIIEANAELRKETNFMSAFGGVGFSDAVVHLYMHNKIDMQPAESVEVNAAAVASLKKLDAARDAYEKVEREIQDKAREPQMQLLMKMREIKDELSDDDTDDPELKQRRKELKDRFAALLEQTEAQIENTPEAHALKEAEFEFGKLGHLARERAIYERIAEYEAENGQLQHVVVVYGDDHKLRNVHVEFNNNNSPEEIDRGLIEIRDKKEE